MSHFTMLDGGIVGLYLIATMVAGLMVRKYIGKVEHFLVAGREMDVYLGIASLAATEFGIVTCMYTAQNGYEKGFAGIVPGITYFLAMLFVGLTGFCIKPLRESGVITIPELFEKRFGTRIRWLSGVVIVLGGLLNMGVFLRIGGDFLVRSTGLSPDFIQSWTWLNPSTIAFLQSHTLEITMTLLLVFVMVYTVLGGMLSVLVTDFMQFVVMSAGLIVVTILILHQVGWGKLVSTVQTQYGAGGFNPLRNGEMGWPYLIFNILLNTAAVLTWQTVIVRVLAAKDTKTGRKVYVGTSFFFVCRFLIPSIWGIAALATLAPGMITKSTTLTAMPTFLARELHMPMGIMGLMIAAMLAADMSTDSSYMLTWGGLIYNDILGVFRRKSRPVNERRGIFWNRIIVLLIGVFLMFYGLWYDLSGKNVWDYLTVTGSIYLSSMSVLLIACCYWKHANNWGAGAAIFCGAFFPLMFLVLNKYEAQHSLGPVFGLTKSITDTIGPHYSGIAAFAGSAAAMVIGSLLKPASKEVSK